MLTPMPADCLSTSMRSRMPRWRIIAAARLTTCAILGALSIAIIVKGNNAWSEEIREKREILAIYDSLQEGEAQQTRIHRYAELPLNHLGLIVQFHDIRKGLPEPNSVEQRYRGILTWFVGSVPDEASYLAWASQISHLDVHYAILGDIGIRINQGNIFAVNELLKLAGLRQELNRVSPIVEARVVLRDKSLFEFECRLDPVLPDFPVITAVGDTRIGVVLETVDFVASYRSVAVAIGSKVAYAALNYEFCHPRPPLYLGRWLINPFEFFRLAFAVGDLPVPDTTTASGRRLYFCVLGTEGWFRLSTVDKPRGKNEIAAEVVLRNLVEPFEDLPFTIDVVESRRLEKSSVLTNKIYQEMVARPNVDRVSTPLRRVLSRFDVKYPSISNLSPLVSAVERIPNISISDEMSYRTSATPLGQDTYGLVQETIANTGAVNRLKPFNLNFFAYAGEYPALMRSVKSQLEAAHLASLSPVSWNDYAAIVEGFHTTKIDRIGAGTWRVSNRGALQTIRFDSAEGREVNFRSSIGVLGERREGGILYVSLDQTVEPAVVSLGELGSSINKRPFVLVESRWRIRNLRVGDCRAAFDARGYGPGEFFWAGVSPGTYSVAMIRSGADTWRQAVRSDYAGRLEFRLPSGAVDPVAVEINCLGKDSGGAELSPIK